MKENPQFNFENQNVTRAKQSIDNGLGRFGENPELYQEVLRKNKNLFPKPDANL